MKKTLTLFAILVIPLCQAASQITVEPWYQGKDAAMSLTFDDGTKSHYTYLRPVLNQFHLKATFYLNTILLSEHPVENALSGSWDEFGTLADEGHDLGSHGVNHPDLTTLEVGDSLTQNTMAYELWESKRVIEEKMGDGYRCITHAYPFCTNNATVREVTGRYYQSARTCSSMKNPATPNYLALNSQLYSWPGVRNTFFDDFRLLNSFMSTVKNSIIGSGAWGVLLCHEVLPFSQVGTAGTWEPTSIEWMTEACRWMEEQSDRGTLWVGTMADVTRYAKERDAFHFTELAGNEDTVSYYIADDLDNDIFSFPLSLGMEVPAGWKNVRVVHGDVIRNLAVDTEGGVVRADLVPGEDTVILTALPDDQLLLVEAAISTSGTELLMRFNSPVLPADTLETGILFMVVGRDPEAVTGYMYEGTDSLTVKTDLSLPVTAGAVVSLSITESEILSADSSLLPDEGPVPVVNRSELVENPYKVLSVSAPLIQQDENAADVNFYLFSTSDFALELESDWLTLSSDNGTGYDTLSVHFAENATGSDRMDTLYITSEDGFEEMVILSQSAADTTSTGKEIRDISPGDLKLYPSPATHSVSLSVPETIPLPANISMFSPEGRLLRKFSISERSAQISVNDLSPGYYVLQLETAGSALTERFLVQ
jgi:peptidoglycan/xylan/chitin deacetylase (PgdA/CDA1 family)